MTVTPEFAASFYPSERSREYLRWSEDIVPVSFALIVLLGRGLAARIVICF